MAIEPDPDLLTLRGEVIFRYNQEPAMATAKLRKVGGSVMVALPPAMLEELQLRPGAAVEVTASEGAVVLTPAKPSYTLDQLLSQLKKSPRRSKDDREWLSDGPRGRELI